MGSDGEHRSVTQLPERGRAVPAAERGRENRALWRHASALMEPQAVLAFRCECEHLLCGDFVVLTLAEYDAATAGLRAVVVNGHADVDRRDVVARTSRFSIVEGAQVA
jgi:hypothetical protein